MFGNLFKKNVTRADVNKPEVTPIVINKEDVAMFEKEIENSYRDLSLTFRDTRTGELHVVVYEDDETFYKLIQDKNMRLVYS